MHCTASVPEPPRIPRRLCGTATTSRLVVGGYGLRIVDTLALYWDWEGEAGGPLTVRALLDRGP
ncbi:hypothetical protein [Nocardiopsis sp. EMB25]|uniref:hypothetical protein n=1 Tax=Nocardiopsis sp. EMB25 TaxID=2835867 RepID=UPI002E152F57